MNKTLPSRACLELFIALVKHGKIAYSEYAKSQFCREGKKILRALADLMDLPEGSYDIRWNPGGPAVSGDITLHGENIYIDFSQVSGMGQFLYRSCKGKKDYRGGPNHWMNWDELLDLQNVAAEIKKVGVPS